MNTEPPTLDELAAELESVADKLRAEAIDHEEAADLSIAAPSWPADRHRDRRTQPFGRRGPGPGTPPVSKVVAASYPIDLQHQSTPT